MKKSVRYPTGSRYTLQWLEHPNEFVQPMIPNNSDAAFKKNTGLPKPSDLLLHYNYGAAAVKHWGHGIEILQNRPNLPSSCPRMPVLAPTGPVTSDGGMVESASQEVWDEDDVMLFFWSNSAAARERRLKKLSENTQRIEQWKGGIP